MRTTMIAKRRIEFKPDYAVPPGATLLETIQSLGLSQAELAKRTGRPLKTINEIIKGKAAITAETALQLEHVLALPASFWNNLERNYRQTIASLKEQKSLEAATEWVKRFPVKELTQRGVLSESREGGDLVRAMFQFFGVSSISAWSQVWTAPAASYRRSTAFRACPESTAAWLRLGEVSARKLRLPAFERTVFKQQLGRMRGLMKMRPAALKRSLTAACRKAGVAVVFVEELPHTSIHGAVRWVGDHPIIQLSCRYKVEDIFWFTFFHEAGHVALHGKRDVFLEDGAGGNDKEREADAFATTHLIPESQWRRFIVASKFTEPGIRALADSLGISAGIVVGRLQHEGRIPFSRFNYLKKRFDLTQP
ncbi:MAG: HigA family addiction module antidote protein [Acidobacteriia bacterium]|nr:HigA family addiction module antidote protein [Terriglobia bacterium]